MGYDNSNKVNFSVGSDGILTIANPAVSGAQDIYFPNNVHIGTPVMSSANLAIGGNIYVSTGITSGGGFYGDGSGLTNLNLSGYATESYVNSYVSGALSNYVTSTDLSSALSNYVTNSSLSSTLAGYVTTSSISAYPNTLGGSPGDIQYNNGSGGLAASGSLHWDGSALTCAGDFYSTANAGFGTSSPSHKVDILGASGADNPLSITGDGFALVRLQNTNSSRYTTFQMFNSSSSEMGGFGYGGSGGLSTLADRIFIYTLGKTINFTTNYSVAGQGLTVDGTTGALVTGISMDSPIYYAGGTAPVADGVHVLITGLTQNGSITTKGGIITATQQVI